eukprot:scaffold340034_cov17-Prasinocladus_malaysianus.AAC.1
MSYHVYIDAFDCNITYPEAGVHQRGNNNVQQRKITRQMQGLFPVASWTVGWTANNDDGCG